ncbi:PREDICTED: ras-related protein Rab-3C [Condylura cristata]|uniref:ras-related protein Rab-3C n=1 Tax=Condylura cristata TaxID=143302 RepID=UPI0006429991|nr:PREDICTED: ras-related protein Rab-3C [Condylura cristata]
MELYGKMASTQDARFGQKDSSDQNFDYMFKLLIIGNSSVGKTSFLFRYADDSFTSAFVSTVGIDFKVKTVFKNEKRIKLQIWLLYLYHLVLGPGRIYKTSDKPTSSNTES